jgi:hypothetical protein
LESTDVKVQNTRFKVGTSYMHHEQ